jgi:uncharacterized damage-inducible protein DinB
MKFTEFFLAELDREGTRTRDVLRQVPADKYDWKPHDKSMKFGSLAGMLAGIPGWIAMQVTKDEFDIAPASGSSMAREPKTTSAALIQSLDESLTAARGALRGTSDAHLSAPWQFKRGGEVVQEAPRYQMIQDTFNHWAHHRGQMTVYLRLMGAKVPAIYGPSADDKSFR